MLSGAPGFSFNRHAYSAALLMASMMPLVFVKAARADRARPMPGADPE
jgi:hypothetical protein